MQASAVWLIVVTIGLIYVAGVVGIGAFVRFATEHFGKTGQGRISD